MSSRVVRFYDLRVRRDNELPGREVEAGFWQKLAEIIGKRDPAQRDTMIKGRRIFGERRVSGQSARPYLYVELARRRAEWPDTLHDDGSYVVPFGDRNRVAIMSMSSASSSVSALEEWLTAQSGMDREEHRISLIPIGCPHGMKRPSRGGRISRASHAARQVSSLINQ